MSTVRTAVWKTHQVVLGFGHVGVVWTEPALVDLQSSAVIILHLFILALILTQQRQIIQLLRHVRMILPQHLTDRQTVRQIDKEIDSQVTDVILCSNPGVFSLFDAMDPQIWSSSCKGPHPNWWVDECWGVVMFTDLLSYLKGSFTQRLSLFVLASLPVQHSQIIESGCNLKHKHKRSTPDHTHIHSFFITSNISTQYLKYVCICMCIYARYGQLWSF